MEYVCGLGLYDLGFYLMSLHVCITRIEEMYDMMILMRLYQIIF